MAACESERILRPGRTCWRLAQADRFSLVIDGAEYFAFVMRAMRQAEEQILLIGWDFDTRVRLIHEQPNSDWPDKLGPFINALIERRPGLRVHVLKWDVGILQTLGRGATPLLVLDWMTNERLHFRLDSAHPLGACQHHKIVVIDDAIAFCGGIDITVGRWDTRKHLDNDPRRKSPWGIGQEPWHDATAAVDGDAARALGELARERWEHATGERLDPPSTCRDVWPEGLEPTFGSVEIGIARTQPQHDGQHEVREIQALYLAAIRSAREAIYIESQYLASQEIGDALANRLRETGGPEIVVVNPCSAEGWLEEKAMSSARALIVERLREADHENRFGIYFPVTAGGTEIYVHAKMLVVDDRFLRVGSSNLNNRSMRLDTECDVALEPVPGSADEEAIRNRIRDARDGLLAEHLGTSPEEVVAVQGAAGGSLLRAIEQLRRNGGRTLLPLNPGRLSRTEKTVAETHLLDPERPEPITGKIMKLFTRPHEDVLGTPPPTSLTSRTACS